MPEFFDFIVNIIFLLSVIIHLLSTALILISDIKTDMHSKTDMCSIGKQGISTAALSIGLMELIDITDIISPSETYSVYQPHLTFILIMTMIIAVPLTIGTQDDKFPWHISIKSRAMIASALMLYSCTVHFLLLPQHIIV